jgi:hypothetical protein
MRSVLRSSQRISLSHVVHTDVSQPRSSESNKATPQQASLCTTARRPPPRRRRRGFRISLLVPCAHVALLMARPILQIFETSSSAESENQEDSSTTREPQSRRPATSSRHALAAGSRQSVRQDGGAPDGGTWQSARLTSSYGDGPAVLTEAVPYLSYFFSLILLIHT